MTTVTFFFYRYLNLTFAILKFLSFQFMFSNAFCIYIIDLFFYVVLDDEDTSFTVGCIVTVYVNLKRQMMKVLFNKEELSHVDEDQENIAIKIEDKDFNEDPVRNIK